MVALIVMLRPNISRLLKWCLLVNIPKLPERFGIPYAVSGVSAPVEPKSTLRSLAV